MCGRWVCVVGAGQGNNGTPMGFGYSKRPRKEIFQELTGPGRADGGSGIFFERSCYQL